MQVLTSYLRNVHANGSTGPLRRWRWRRPLDVLPGNVDSTLNNFPIYLDETVFNQLPDFWINILNGGGDLRASSDPNGSVLLNVEVELLNTSTQTAAVWIKIPVISAVTNTRIYLFYGRSGVTQPAPGSAGGRFGVWDANTQVFLPMNDQLTPLDDSTANINSFGTSGNLPTQVPGKNGFAQFFDGAGDYATHTPFNEVDFGTIFTFSAWFRSADGSGGAVFGKGDGDGIWESNEKQIMFGDGTTGLAQAGLVPTLVAFGLNWVISANPISNGVWTKVDWVYNITGPVRLIYINGVSQSLSLANYSGVADSAGWAGMLGRKISNDVNQDFHGDMDSVKISNAVRSAAWLKFEYHTQNTPAANYNVPAF